ncbi:MAG: DMT family transporter [Burkholderiales bacterium]
MTLASSARGIVAMTAGAGLLTVNDAVTKYLTAHYPVSQVVCLRQVASLLFILPYAWAVTGAGALKVVNYGGQALRGSLFLCGAALVTASLYLLPLSLVTVILLSSPLFVALVSAPILGERVHAYQWIAVAVGFVGVLMIVQPGTRSAEWIVVLPVVAAFSNALRDVITRRLSRTESSMSMLFWSGVIVCVGGAFTIPFGWKAIELESGVWFLAAGLSNALAHFMVIEAFRLGNAAVVAPFRYSGLLWALLIGFLVWREVPNAWMLAGAAVVVCAGLYMLRQSTRRAA